MTRIKGQLTTADYLPYKEFLRLLDALDRDGEYLGETYCWLSFCTAFRASDVRTLKWKDVLGKKELVRIEQKTQKSRKVKFNAGVVEKTAGLYEKLGRPATDSYILPIREQRPLTRWNISIANSRFIGSSTEFRYEPSPHILSEKHSVVMSMS